MGKTYDAILTVLLIIVIVAIVGLLGFWLYEMYTKSALEREAMAAIKDFEEAIKQSNTIQNDEISNVVENVIINEVEENIVKPEVNNVETPPATNNTPESKPTTFKGYKLAGYIEIPKTKVNLPVLEAVTGKSLEVAVGVLHGPGLNKVGNTIIVGHNYRNSKFFSNNDKIAIGDKIYITDMSGNKVTYVVYNQYLTTPEDADYMIRETNGTREISLSTCTDDSSKRIITWAREQ